MFKSLAYKEWIKIRWAYAVSFAVGIIVLLVIYLNMRAVVEFNNANIVWNYIVFKNYMFFAQFEFIPLLIALVIAVAQFFPEIQNLRLKLTLHLPLKENTVLIFLLTFGFVLLLLQYIIFTVGLILISVKFFPAEITYAMLISVIPWFLAGLAVYFLTAVVMVEQLWLRRIIIALFGFGFVDILMTGDAYGQYIYVIPYFTIFTLLLGYLIILSGFRFKRGVR
jgi:hypothetical protein